MLRCCRDWGIPALTAYAFSTENWGRPLEEVEFLMTLFERVLRRELEEMMQQNVKIRFIGNLSVWAWMFLFGHLIWATGFMFLISWRGYWQELIETLVWAHERTPLANLVRWRDKPVALSIVQARLVGLVHFTVGYILTYAAFVIASTSGKFG